MDYTVLSEIWFFRTGYLSKINMASNGLNNSYAYWELRAGEWLKMISSPYCALSSVYVFCFVQCETSQNVNISQPLTWSTFHASFFLISLDKTTSQL